MSHDSKKKTLIIQTTSNKGKPHTCKVCDLLMWAEYLRGPDHKHTVSIRRAMWDGKRRKAS